MKIEVEEDDYYAAILNAEMASELYAETLRDLAVALGMDLVPCRDRLGVCPGHLPEAAKWKLNQLRLEWEARRGGQEEKAS